MSKGYKPIRSKTHRTGRVLGDSKALSSRKPKRIGRSKGKTFIEKTRSKFLKKLFGRF